MQSYPRDGVMLCSTEEGRLGSMEMRLQTAAKILLWSLIHSTQVPSAIGSKLGDVVLVVFAAQEMSLRFETVNCFLPCVLR